MHVLASLLAFGHINQEVRCSRNLPRDYQSALHWSHDRFCGKPKPRGNTSRCDRIVIAVIISVAVIVMFINTLVNVGIRRLIPAHFRRRRGATPVVWMWRMALKLARKTGDREIPRQSGTSPGS